MNFVDLQCFVAAVEEMNFTRAAKRLYISQQSLSSHIAKLEEHYGLKLFDRNPPLTVTAAGDILLKYAHRLLKTELQASAELQALKGNYDGELRLGISSFRSNIMMPRLLPLCHERYPNVRIKLLEAPLAQVTESLLRGRVDMVIGYETEDGQEVHSDVLYEEEVKLAIPESIFDVCFAKAERERLLQLTRIPLLTVRNCPFIKLGEGTWLGDMVDACSREHGIKLNVQFETVSIETMISLCKAGIGAMVCPEIYIDEAVMRQKRIRLFCLSDPGFKKKVAVNYIENKYQSRAAKDFIAMAKELFGAPSA